MLHAVAELAEHGLGEIQRVLRHEVNADALRADEAHDLLDSLEQRLRRLVEEEMCFVEEEDEPGLLRVAELRQMLEELRQEPEQERRIELRRLHQLVGGENAHHAFAVLHAHEIGDVEHRLAEELRPALALEREEAALDGADRRGGDVAILRLELRGVVADMLQHRAQVLQVEEQQPIVVRDLENDGEHALLDFIQSEHAPEKQRPHVRDRRAHRMSRFAEHIPEDHRARRALRRQLQLLAALVHFRVGAARFRKASEIAFDVGHEHRHADRREPLGDDLQRDRFAGAGRPGDEAVAVGERRQEAEIQVAVLGNDQGVGHRGTSDSKGMWRSLALALSAIDRT